MNGEFIYAMDFNSSMLNLWIERYNNITYYNFKDVKPFMPITYKVIKNITFTSVNQSNHCLTNNKHMHREELFTPGLKNINIIIS